MRSLAKSIMLAVLIALLSGCATQETPEQRANRIERMLAASGFQAHPADTPAKQQSLQAMTPLKLQFMPKGGKVHYWFADPVVCNCLYTGNQRSTAIPVDQRKRSGMSDFHLCTFQRRAMRERNGYQPIKLRVISGGKMSKPSQVTKWRVAGFPADSGWFRPLRAEA